MKSNFPQKWLNFKSNTNKGYLWNVKIGFGGRALWLDQTWEVAAWEIEHLGSFRLGNDFGKVPDLVQLPYLAGRTL